MPSKGICNLDIAHQTTHTTIMEQQTLRRVFATVEMTAVGRTNAQNVGRFKAPSVDTDRARICAELMTGDRRAGHTNGGRRGREEKQQSKQRERRTDRELAD